MERAAQNIPEIDIKLEATVTVTFLTTKHVPLLVSRSSAALFNFRVMLLA